MVLSPSASASLFTLALFAATTQAAPSLNVKRAPGGFTMKGSGTGVGALDLSPSPAAGSVSGSGQTVADVQDVLYLIEIVLAKNTYIVQMDTGSSDLWVYAPDDKMQLTNQTGITATEAYGQGVAEGEIVFGELQLGSYTIPSQAFISASSAEDFSFFSQGAVGILGLAFDDVELSAINAELEAAYGATTLGRTPISSIFAQNPDTPNAFDVHLDRTSDLDDTASGLFFIGEHDPAFANVSAQPRLARQTVGRWSVPLDGMDVNGAAFAFAPSSIDTVPAGKIAALLDTGFSFPPLQPEAVDAIYSTIPGAVKYSDQFPQWIVPCDQGTNVTFTFGGLPFAVHPLDLTAIQTTEITQNGQSQNVTFCINTYQYLDLDPTSFSGFDAILGDAFLRNVYASFDYGDTDSSGNQSFVQLVSTTDPVAAWSDFAASRKAALAQLPPTIDPKTLVSISNGGDTDDSVAGADAVPSSTTVGSVSTPTGAAALQDGSTKLYDLVDKYGPVIVGLLAGNILIGVLLCAIALAACMRKGAARSRSINSSYAPVRFKEADAHSDRTSYHD